MAKSRSRADLLEEVQYGRMTPEEAEAEARAAGLEPLSFVPDPADFNPMREPFWSAVMAVAWIAWRTPDAVREVWNDYRVECRDWVNQEWRVGLDGPVHAGAFLQRRRPATLMMVRFVGVDFSRDGDDPVPLMALHDAFDELMDALRSGHVTAAGLPSDGGARCEIPALEWIDLKHVSDLVTDDFRTDPVRAGRSRTRTFWCRARSS